MQLHGAGALKRLFLAGGHFLKIRCSRESKNSPAIPIWVQSKAVKLTQSKVHSWGLSAAEPMPAEQFVIENTGKLICLSVNTIRERKDADSDYRFRVNDQWVVDVTTKVGS